MGRLKPKIEGLVETAEIRNFSGVFRRLLTSTLWRVSCPCHRRGEYAIALVATWNEALDRALEHGRTFHA